VKVNLYQKTVKQKYRKVAVLMRVFFLWYKTRISDKFRAPTALPQGMKSCCFLNRSFSRPQFFLDVLELDTKLCREFKPHILGRD
jgi:hypothetical protein